MRVGSLKRQDPEVGGDVLDDNVCASHLASDIAEVPERRLRRCEPVLSGGYLHHDPILQDKSAFIAPTRVLGSPDAATADVAREDPLE